MKNLKTKAFIYLLVVPSVLVWAILLYRFDINMRNISSIGEAWEALRLIPPVITIDLIAWWIFVKWAWKFRMFQGWLVPFPVLTGTWEGELRSTWVDSATSKPPDPIPVVLVIKQSFLTISATMHSHDMESRSFAAEFLIDRDTGSKRLVYTYTSTPKVALRNKSRVHDGTALLTIKDEPERKLDGEYWTNRESTGDINLRYRTHKILEDLPQDLSPSSSDTYSNGN